MPRLPDRGLRRLLLAAGPALVAIGVGVLAVDGARRTRDLGAWVEQSHTVIETADGLLTRMVDAETAQRGFILTGDEAFLEPARGAEADVNRALSTLGALTRDDPEQQRRMAPLSAAVARRFALLAEGIQLRRTGGLAAATDFVRQADAQRAMDAARAVVGDVERDERRLLVERRDREERHGRTTVILVVGGALLAGVLGLLANLAIVSSAAAEARAGRELARANERLLDQGAELERRNEQLQEQTETLAAQRSELARQATELERRAAEVQRLNGSLERQVRDLAALNAGLESFSYTVSHDLRTPLGAINGLSTLLLEDYAACLDDAGREMLARVKANAVHMADLIDGLLELSRVSRGEVKVERVDLTQLARDIAASLARQSPDRTVAFEVEEGLAACGDRRLVAALVQNLLANAWKFSAKRPDARVEVRAWPEAPDTFFIRDNGAGFDMQYAAKLFGAFQRLHGSSEFEGTGIGLATVDRVARRHGGAVWAEGAVGQGATFYVTLPSGACGGATADGDEEESGDGTR